MHYATTSDGVRIAYVSVGDGSPVVFGSNIFGDASRYCAGDPARVRTDGLPFSVVHHWESCEIRLHSRAASPVSCRRL